VHTGAAEVTSVPPFHLPRQASLYSTDVML
jgi:hypothetical protein